MRDVHEPLLEVRGIKTQFRTQEGIDRTYLDDISFRVYPGEILALVGESGSGKSLTSLSIMGLLSQNGNVAAGEILFDGVDLRQLSEEQLDDYRGNRISMIFQDALTSLNPSFTIGNQIVESLRVHKGYKRREAKERALQLLTRVGLPSAKEIYNEYPHTLSGGMRQRVMIAIALACSPDLLIADEATTALDVTIQAQIMRFFRELRDEEGMSIILITHDMGLVAEMADRIVVLYAGQIVEVASVHELFAAPHHPYTAALMKSIPHQGMDPDTRLTAIPGMVPEDYDQIEFCRFAPRCDFANDRCFNEAQVLETEEDGRKVRCGRWSRGELKDELGEHLMGAVNC